MRRSIPHPRLAANVIALRDHRGLTSSKLAARCRVPLSTLSRLLNGDGDCNLQTAAALAKGLGYPLDALVCSERELQTYLAAPQVEASGAVAMPPVAGPVTELRLLSADGRCEELGEAPTDAGRAQMRVYRLRGDCLSPVLRDGWLLLSPSDRQPSPGQPVLAVLQSGECCLRELTFERPHSVVLTALCDHGDRLTLERADLRALHGIACTLYGGAP